MELGTVQTYSPPAEHVWFTALFPVAFALFIIFLYVLIDHIIRKQSEETEPEEPDMKIIRPEKKTFKRKASPLSEVAGEKVVYLN
jgi:hypothetical protein